MSDPKNIVWHQHTVTREERERANGHRGCVVWFTGLSGCGKSTIANEVDRLLFAQNVKTYLLDGDNVRHGLNAPPAVLRQRHDEDFAQRFGLGFGPQDREENIRRIGAVAQLFCDAGVIVLSAFVSPYRRDRDAVRATLAAAGSQRDFVEVFVDTPLEVCESRDPKGLYKKARAGEIAHFTGISDPYETPNSAELTLDGDGATPAESAAVVVEFLRSGGWLD